VAVRSDIYVDKPMSQLRVLVRAMINQDRRSLVWVAAIQLVSTATQGIGLLLLVPLLDLAGVGGRPAATTSGSSLVQFARSFLGVFRIPLTLPALLVLYAITVAVAAALNGYSTVRLLRYRLEFIDTLRVRLYGALAAAEWRHHVALRQSDVLTTLTANVSWVSLGILACLNLATASVFMVVQLVVAVRISPVVTGLAAGTGALLLIFVWPLIRKSRQLGGQLVAHNRNVLAAITGFLGGLKLAKAHGLERDHVDTFNTAIRGSRESQISFATAQAVSTSLQLVVTAIVLAVVVDISVEHLHLALASLLVVAFIFSRLVPQIASAQQNLLQIAQSLPAFSDLESVIASCEENSEPPAAVGSRPRRIGLGITLDGVSFAWVPGVNVLKEVTLDIPARRTTAIVGPSGAGKTTLADIVAGLLEPTDGRVLIDGDVLHRVDLRSWRHAISLVPQEPYLFNETLRTNLVWANPEATEAEMWDALDMATAGFVAQLPEGLDSFVGDRGARLSGGERQRIALARALLRRPELLILDEATSSLDNESELAIRQALAALHGRTTMLVIAHRLSTVSTADSIIVLEGGRIVEEGTWTNLRSREGGRLRALIDAGLVG
jgi:ATP-binding cassette subfamily C protein